MKTAAVVQHVPFEDLGSFEAVLSARAFKLTYLLAGRDDLAVGLGDPDLFISLGGPISVNDENDYPFLRDELGFLEKRLRADRPCLGICLGAQLMSKALGGKVRAMERKEIGWAPLQVVHEASPLSALGMRSTVLHWHGEEFSIPAGATLLASSALCQNQAFSWGKRGLGLQFHPEVTSAGLELWYIAHTIELGAARVDIRELRQQTEQHASALVNSGRRLLERWLDSCEL